MSEASRAIHSPLDHLLWAVPELEAGRLDVSERSGVEPQLGGRHPGFGTHNALLHLGDRCYLEVIAPDPTQTRLNGLGSYLEGLESPSLVTWCAASEDLEAVAAAARENGLEPGEITSMGRKRPDGSELRWQILPIGGHPYGGLLPFFIAWGETPHPAGGAPKGCRLRELRLGSPDSDALSRVLEALGLEVRVDRRPEPRISATLDTPRGPLELRGE